MLLKLGLRNILRNRRRTIITCLIMGLGLTALIFADAFLRGLNENMITSVTSSFIGDGQIHRKNFLSTRELEKTIIDANHILNQIQNDTRIKMAVPRTIANGMISSPTDIIPIAIYGIDPVGENAISSMQSSLIAGNFIQTHLLENDNQIMIGEKLAKFLNVNIGDKVVLTASQARTGILSQELFRIIGIYKMKNKEMDSSMAFISIKKAQSMMGIGDNFHEIVFKFKNRNDVINPPQTFLDHFSQNDSEALSWKKLVPAIDAGIQLTSYSLSIGSFILFAIIALSTMNTLFMSLFERMYEFGIMKAIGTRSMTIFKLILIEASLLAIISCVVGVILGGIITLITQYTGINHLTDVEYLGTTIKSAIRPMMTNEQYTLYPIAIFFFAVLSALYPAISAARIIPSKSMRRD